MKTDNKIDDSEIEVEMPQSRSKFSSIMIKIGILLGSLYVLISVLIPIILLAYPSIVKQLVFMNIIKLSTNFTQPETFGLDRVQNFYLNVEPDVSLGIWHYRSPLIKDQLFDNDEDYFEKYFSSTSKNIPIIIYLHGNAVDRSLITRRELCKKLRDELKYDVIAFDYRGFGDSTGEPSEAGLVKDARFIYDWLQKLSHGKRKIYLWGHSMGASVASQLAAQLSNEQSKTLGGLIMEAPFLNIHQALLTHWFSLFFRWQPWYYSSTEKALQKNKLYFDTSSYISKIDCPCVLIHADDDLTVPYIHSKELLQAGIRIRNDHKQKKKFLHFTIDMISFHRSGYRHDSIYKAPKLIPALKRIIFEEDLETNF